MDEVMEIEEVPSNSSLKDKSVKDKEILDDNDSSKDNESADQTDETASKNNGNLCDAESKDNKATLENSETNHCDAENKNSHENHVDNTAETESNEIDDSVCDEQNESEEKNSSANDDSKVESDTPKVDSSNKSNEEKDLEEDISSSLTIVEDENVGKDKDAEEKDKDVEEEKDDVNNKDKANDAGKDTGKDSNEGDVEITDVVKKKDDSSKKKKGKICVVCGKKRKIEFRIHFQGKVQLLCSDKCYKQFKEKQLGKSESKTEEPKSSEPIEDSFCAQCQKLIFTNQGLYPVVGDIKPLCSEDCVRKYQEKNGLPRKCSQCDKRVEDKSVHLTWETMVFCGEECLGKYQSFLGSHCTCCQGPVQQASLGKYCVCFGSDIRQFCSGSCLDDFKKGLKVCTFCQTDLSAGTEGFLAPVGDKGQFKDFCSQACMERYETMNNISKSASEVQECAHCKKQGTFKIQVPYKDKKYFLCCDSCVSGLRCTLKKSENVCASCHRFFDQLNDVNSNKENDYKFKMDGLYKFFCSKTCITTYVLSHRRITQCLFCKVKKYNFDMIEKVDRSESGQKIFCSLNCLSLHKVNANAASSKSIRCDNCTKVQPAQYHLTMSDGSIRNFCAYNCVLAFQNQFTSVPALTTTSMTRQMTTPVQTLKTTAAVSAPVIANVVSLAQPRAGTPAANKPLVPQALVSVRPTRQPLAVFSTKVSTVTSPSTPVSTSTGSQIMREVIIQPPAPKSVKNKTIWCKPIMHTKAVNTRSSACDKAVQTDDSPRPIILPVPVPVYVPTPLHMFSRPVPCPVPFPVPIPVPIIIPASKEQHNVVVKQLKKYQENMSCISQEDKTGKFSDSANSALSGEASDGTTENHKRTLSSPINSKHKKLKSDQDADQERIENSCLPSCGEEPSQVEIPENTFFETPSFSFDDEEQTLLKVP